MERGEPRTWGKATGERGMAEEDRSARPGAAEPETLMRPRRRRMKARRSGGSSWCGVQSKAIIGDDSIKADG